MTFFEPEEAAFDDIVFFIRLLVESAIAAFLSVFAAPLGYHWDKAIATTKSAYPFGVISFVRHQKRQTFAPGHIVHAHQKGDQTLFECGRVIDVTRRQNEPQRIAALVANQVELGGEASTGTTERLVFFFVFFGAPAAWR